MVWICLNICNYTHWKMTLFSMPSRVDCAYGKGPFAGGHVLQCSFHLRLQVWWDVLTQDLSTNHRWPDQAPIITNHNTSQYHLTILDPFVGVNICELAWIGWVPDGIAWRKPFQLLAQAVDALHQLSVLLADFHFEAAHLFFHLLGKHMGLSENSVPLNPMVNDHYPY